MVGIQRGRLLSAADPHYSVAMASSACPVGSLVQRTVRAAVAAASATGINAIRRVDYSHKRS